MKKYITVEFDYTRYSRKREDFLPNGTMELDFVTELDLQVGDKVFVPNFKLRGKKTSTDWIEQETCTNTWATVVEIVEKREDIKRYREIIHARNKKTKKIIDIKNEASEQVAVENKISIEKDYTPTEKEQGSLFYFWLVSFLGSVWFFIDYMGRPIMYTTDEGVLWSFTLVILLGVTMIISAVKKQKQINKKKTKTPPTPVATTGTLTSEEKAQAMINIGKSLTLFITVPIVIIFILLIFIF